MNRAKLGRTGEAIAAKYYIRQGYLDSLERKSV